MASSRILVAAIDFGTAYSGAAISFCHEYKRDPTQIYALEIGNSRMSMKTTTCILIRPDGETCYLFGEDAESSYYQELEELERKEWYFFKRFKMELYNNTQNIKDFKLKGENGKRLPAMRVFKLAIRYLKDQVLVHCNKRLHGVINESEIGWVLTVPAIWTDKAKGFMREAAEEAGIARDQLTIALEPEAASIFCQNLPLVREQPDVAKFVPFKTGMKYAVVDCGGGTVDITVHEVSDKKPKTTSIHTTNYIKEVHKAGGNDMGGIKVDETFLSYLASIVGEDVLHKYQEEEFEDFFELMYNFEEKKRKVTDGGLKMTITAKLIDTFAKQRRQPLKDYLAEIDNTDITIRAGKIRIPNHIAKGFFEKSVSSIISELRAIFERPEVADCSSILLVGGYSESLLLQERVRKAFETKTIICPKDAGLAVLKGAVIFGHNPGAISERISRYTYGTDLIGDRFDKLVEIGERLEVGKSNIVKIYHPCSPNLTSLSVNIYISPNPNPELLSEDGCTKIMPRSFPIPDTTGGCDRKIEMCMIFGGTEFTVKVKDHTTGHEETFFVSSWD